MEKSIFVVVVVKVMHLFGSTKESKLIERLQNDLMQMPPVMQVAYNSFSGQNLSGKAMFDD